MKTATKKLRSPLKWHGGKSYLARRIIELMPRHRIYIEPFAGGLSVLLNKPQSPTEIVGDLDGKLMLFWGVMGAVTNFWRLRDCLAEKTYTEETFLWAKPGVEHAPPNPWEQPGLVWSTFAAMYLIRNRFSRGGLGKDFAWSERLRGKTRPGGPIPGDANAWDTIREELPAIHRRIEDARFVPTDASDLIKRFDQEGSLTYADPPYCHETRTHKTAYAHEMTRDQHAELLDTLKGCRGSVMLSGYRSTLYDDTLSAWRRVEFDMPNHSGQGKSKQRRIECVWCNF